MPVPTIDEVDIFRVDDRLHSILQRYVGDIAVHYYLARCGALVPLSAHAPQPITGERGFFYVFGRCVRAKVLAASSASAWPIC